MDEIKLQFDTIGTGPIGERGRVVVDGNPLRGIKQTIVTFEHGEELPIAIERALRESGLRLDPLRTGV